MRSMYKLCIKALLARFVWQDLCNRSLCNVSVQDLQKRWPGKICVQLYKKSLGKTLEEISVQAFYKSSFGKISVRELLARLLYKISTRALRTRSLHKLSIKDLLVKISVEDLLDHENEHRATTRAIRQAQSDERVARAISQEPFCVEMFRKNAGRPGRGHRFVRASAVEMHMDMSQEPFSAEI